MPPIRVLTTILRAVAARPTSKERRAPYDKAAQEVSARLVGTQQILG